METSSATVPSRAAVTLLELGLLLVIPLVFYRGFAEQFTYIKLVLTEGLVFVGAVGWSLGLIWGHVRWPGDFRLKASLGFLFLAVFCSCLASPLPAFSLGEAEYFLCGPLWLLLLCSWGTGASEVRWLAALATVAGAGVATVALLQWTGHDPLLWGGYQVDWGAMVARMRLYSTFGNPNFLCGYLIGAVFAGFILALVSESIAARIGSILATALMLSAIVGSGSFGGWAGLLAGSFVFAFVVTRTSRPAAPAGFRKIGLSIAGVLALLAAAGLYVWLSGGTLSDSIGQRIEGRVYLWNIGWRMFADHPFLGSGWGTFQLHFLDYQSRYLALHPEMNRFWTMTRELHNDPLQLLGEAGLLGFAAFVWFLRAYARKVAQFARSNQERSTVYWLAASAGGSTAILIDALFNFQFSIPPTFILFFTLVAVPFLLAPRMTPASTQCPLAAAAKPKPQFALGALLSIAAVALWSILLLQVVQRATAERDYARGSALEARGDWTTAEKAARQGLSKNPLNGRLHFALARALYLQQKFPEALKEVLLAERTSSDSHLEVLKARIEDRLGRAGPALSSYRRAVELDPTLVSVQADIRRLSKEE